MPPTNVDADLTSMLRNLMPFCEVLGMTAVKGDASEVVVTGEWSAERCTAGGVLHGGYLMALADSSGASCAVFNLPEGATTSTIESKTNFFRGVGSGYVTATSIPLHVGSTTIVVRTDLVDDRGKPVAVVTQTQIVLRT